MDARFAGRFTRIRHSLRQKRRSWKSPTRWEIIAVVLLVVALVVPYYLAQVGLHPPVGTYIAIMGALAAAVAFRSDPPSREKGAWILVIAMLMVAEIRNLYVAEHEQVQTFLTLNEGLKQTALGLKETLAESTGGDSFCYVDMARLNSDTLVAHLVRKGHYPVFHAVVTINDVDEFDMGMQSGDIISSRRSFQPIEIIPVFSFWQPLTTYPVKSDSSLRTFTAEIGTRGCYELYTCG